MTIRKLPGQRKWRVYSETTGRSFGTYPTKTAAVNRLRQIEAFKHMRRWK